MVLFSNVGFLGCNLELRGAKMLSRSSAQKTKASEDDFFRKSGNSAIPISLLGQDGNTISWTEFQQLAQFR